MIEKQSGRIYKELRPARNSTVRYCLVMDLASIPAIKFELLGQSMLSADS